MTGAGGGGSGRGDRRSNVTRGREGDHERRADLRGVEEEDGVDRVGRDGRGGRGLICANGVVRGLATRVVVHPQASLQA